jgi:IS30 family transposase
MSHYTHLTIEERENILVLRATGNSMQAIANEMNRSKSTISRELSRNTQKRKGYSASAAQEEYLKRRKKCVRRKLLNIPELKRKVQRLLFEQQWSPEQISQRLAYENSLLRISHNTIYRAVYAGMFNTADLQELYEYRTATRKLRHRGKTRRKRGSVETRGKITISNTIHERPSEANKRLNIGHWEADTVLGRQGSSCLVTVTDRHSRFLLAEKIHAKQAEPLADKMIDMFTDIPSGFIKSFTPDRGKEFAKHTRVTAALGGVQFYFPDPHAPWQRGTNENTNGLLREYFPKSCDFSANHDEDIALVVDKINKRPRKCLGWLSPFEVFFGKLLHLT